MDNLLLEFDDDIEKENLMNKLNEDKDKWFELKNDIEKNLINTQKSTASPSRKKIRKYKNSTRIEKKKNKKGYKERLD
jgi:hypothetical protein